MRAVRLTNDFFVSNDYEECHHISFTAEINGKKLSIQIKLLTGQMKKL